MTDLFLKTIHISALKMFMKASTPMAIEVHRGLNMTTATGSFGERTRPTRGDEINRLLPAENYGWPLYSTGLHYDGSRVNGLDLGIAFELSDITQPVVDMTPSPAVSSFIISQSEKFPNWKGDFIVGSLKSRSLFRIDIENNRFVETETLFEGMGAFEMWRWV